MIVIYTNKSDIMSTKARKEKRAKLQKTGAKRERKQKHEGNIASVTKDGRTIYKVPCSVDGKICYTSADHKPSENWKCTEHREHKTPKAKE
jgi:hypothetical protein